MLSQRMWIEQVIGPPLKLIFIALSQLHRRLEVSRHSLDVIVDLLPNPLSKPPLNHFDGVNCNIDSNPFPLRLFSRFNGCAASTKWVENKLT